MVTDEPVLAPVTTHHNIHIGEKDVRYAATFSETLLNDEQGKPQATISSTAYVRDNVGERAKRPVFFLFNGGPGASSSPLHFGALGPRRITDERDAAGLRKLADNAESILDVADLVFVDPVGTGFSRERAGATSGAYWSVDSDARSVLQLIRTWLTQNQRTASPLFIVGESYGGVRLATITRYSGDLPIAGLILVSPALDLSGGFSAPGNDQPFIFDLPTMAIAAWEHGKVERGNRTVAQVYEEGARFAQSDYAVALQQGARLPAADRDRLAARMSAMIGLPASLIAAANLRVDSQVFLESLLQSENRLVGRLDTRISAPKAPPANRDRPAAANDPALAMGASNVKKNDTIKAYMEHELNVHTARDYISLTLDVNMRWDWRGPPPTGAWPEPEFYRNPAKNIAALMAKQKRTRVLLLGGYYDLTIPVLAPRYALEHAGLPLDRVVMVALPAGHSPFEGDETRKMGASAVREFLGEYKP
jgi:carboxypeptidase C (cathepsin A)